MFIPRRVKGEGHKRWGGAGVGGYRIVHMSAILAIIRLFVSNVEFI